MVQHRKYTMPVSPIITPGDARKLKQGGGGEGSIKMEYINSVCLVYHYFCTVFIQNLENTCPCQKMMILSDMRPPTMMSKMPQE